MPPSQAAFCAAMRSDDIGTPGVIKRPTHLSGSSYPEHVTFGRMSCSMCRSQLHAGFVFQNYCMTARLLNAALLPAMSSDRAPITGEQSAGSDLPLACSLQGCCRNRLGCSTCWSSCEHVNSSASRRPRSRGWSRWVPSDRVQVRSSVEVRLRSGSTLYTTPGLKAVFVSRQHNWCDPRL